VYCYFLSSCIFELLSLAVAAVILTAMISVLHLHPLYHFDILILIEFELEIHVDVVVAIAVVVGRFVKGRVAIVVLVAVISAVVAVVSA